MVPVVFTPLKESVTMIATVVGNPKALFNAAILPTCGLDTLFQGAGEAVPPKSISMEVVWAVPITANKMQLAASKCLSIRKRIELLKCNVCPTWQPTIFSFGSMRILISILLLMVFGASCGYAQDHFHSVEEALKNPTKVIYLDLRGEGLTELPEGLRKCYNMIRCELADNALKELPDWIRDWENLHYLGVSNNKLTQLPTAIGEIKYLESLDISNNQLVALPKQMTNNWKLKHVYASNNKLEGGSVIKALKKLSGINTLELRDNPFSDKMKAKLGAAFPIRELRL